MKVVCSFIGHKDIYDVDIEPRLQEAVDRLVENNEAVEFLIYFGGIFAQFSFLAALRARTQCPEKVTITLVRSDLDGDRPNEQAMVFSNLFDRVVTPFKKNAEDVDPYVINRRIQRWLPLNSTHILSYVYEKLYETDSQLPKNQNSPEIICLTVPETEAAILKAATSMTEKEQFIFQRMNEGCTLGEAGAALNIGRERARQILQHGCRTIRTFLRERYRSALAGKKQEDRTCGLFGFGEATFESLTHFEYIIRRLTLTWSITRFYVEESFVHSGFMFVLTNFKPSQYGPHITALIKSAPQTEGRNRQARDAEILSPPCDAVEYVDPADHGSFTDDFSVIASMIKQMDFCACDLSATPFAEEIHKYAAQAKKAVLLDVGKTKGSAVGTNQF